MDDMDLIQPAGLEEGDSARSARGQMGHEPTLTDDELRALELTGALANLLRRIIGDGPPADADWTEMAHHIHVIQRAIGAQAAARAYPSKFRLLGQVIEPDEPDRNFPRHG